MSDSSRPGAPRLVDPGRDVVAATGPESAAYLQGQLSQDVVALGDGGFAWSWLLAPNGKVDALVRVTRLSAEEWLIDTDAGWGDRVLARLARFKLRTKVDFEPSPLTVRGLRGAGWAAPAGSVAVLSPPWPGVEGADVVAPAALWTDPAEEMGRASYEEERILAGIPRMGAEMDERTIPAETGLIALTVSFTKGCYTGQELVARVDSRGGNVPRRLRGLRFAGPAAAGDTLADGQGGPAGAVTSAVRSGAHGWIGLGYVRRGVDPAAPLVTVPGGVAVVVEPVGPPDPAPAP